MLGYLACLSPGDKRFTCCYRAPTDREIKGIAANICADADVATPSTHHKQIVASFGIAPVAPEPIGRKHLPIQADHPPIGPIIMRQVEPVRDLAGEKGGC